ncbi:MAG: adenylate/guanylate cyclase domain-containing protein [Lentisphaeria bacterium]|nr:adenylate/guanylate cyclase domain-containing protein [Lentisphaeria bacterium]
MTGSASGSAGGVSVFVFCRDRLAHLVSGRRTFLGALLCGMAMAWATLSACSVQTPLSRWSWLLALCVVGVSLIHTRVGAVVMGLACTAQMLSLNGQVGVVTAALCLLFVLLCGRHAGNLCGVLVAPYLLGLHLGIAAALGLAMSAGKRVSWFWVGLALVWCVMHGFVVGHPRLGVAPLSQVAESASRAEKARVTFGASWLREALAQADMEELKDGLLGFLADSSKSVPAGVQLLLWCAIAFAVRATYHHRRVKDRIAMEYLEKVTKHTRRIPPHRQMYGAMAMGAVLFVVSYAILGGLSKAVEYSFLHAFMDVVAAALVYFPLWVTLEGDPVAGAASLAERREAHGVTLKDLPVGDASVTPRKGAPHAGGAAAAGVRPGVSPVRPATPAASDAGGIRKQELPPWLRKGPGSIPGALPGSASKAAAARPAVAGAGTGERGADGGASTFAVEAIMFIDMVGSTALGSKYGDDYVLGLKEKLGQIVRAESARQSVLFEKGTGDGFMLTYPEAVHAVTAGVNILRQVDAANQGLPESRAIHLRMGIHLGQVNIDSHGDRIGTAANFAARIEAAKIEQLQAAEDPANVVLPERDRILVSDVVSEELKGNAAFALRPIGYFEFKGISGLHRIFEVQRA